MRVRLLKSITIDNIEYCKNETGWLKCVKWDNNKNYTYLVEIKNKLIEVNKKDIDYD